MPKSLMLKGSGISPSFDKRGVQFTVSPLSLSSLIGQARYITASADRLGVRHLHCDFINAPYELIKIPYHLSLDIKRVGRRDFSCSISAR